MLATNVAETSLTIPGVTAVVDSGWARTLRYDPRVGLDRLELTPISQAAAEQRAGRAGRTQPGLCLRLWDERSQRARPPFEEPEVRRVDLAGAVLQLLCWIEPDPDAFPWFEPPRPEALARARTLLRQLGAADEHGVTKLGGRMARSCPSIRGWGGCWPNPNAKAASLERRWRRRCCRNAARSAGPSEGAPRRRNPDYHSRSDLLDQLAALEEYEATGRGDSAWGPIVRPAARTLFQVRDQLTRQLGGSRAAPTARRGTRRRPCCDRCWRPFRIGWRNAASRDRGAG